MKSYSPYDNVEAKNYPNILITTGLHDSQVQYWEPAKWTAKLRELKTDNNLLLFKTDMTSGHGGASGRFESLKEDALEYAFLLKLEKKVWFFFNDNLGFNFLSQRTDERKKLSLHKIIKNAKD